MTYPRQQLQHITHHIVEQLSYSDEKAQGEKLSKNHKKWITAELMTAIDPLQRRNPKAIVIAKNNQALKAFFATLEDSKILFPENTVYLIKRNGRNYECSNGEKKEIYNRSKAKSKGYNKKQSSLCEQFEMLTIDLSSSDADDSHEEGDWYSSYTPAKSILTLQISESTSAPQITTSMKHSQYRY